ncbi:sigma-70 family RNA polymerase sigma factor [Robiginitalea aurantiaca]|uniref:Sigma-70 family RNA polymerase sigma factor n=1 Tax=Robiginitalea aurantiaca TaxID=3056915 RepID=A0ABT7WHB7_9FLAO|nr:sigma-70 family RNA polymerase sigma factor [Robiginitalea aurantiaca]MDM9632306.1 sigma-70 family RNA polymerase sigma factor [Robiginitalea aurantiaca]
MDSEDKKTKLNPESWVDRYADYLFNYTISRVGSEEAAKDILQDTFVAALQASGRFKGDAAERTWLVAILKHKIIDYYRKSNTLKAKSEVPLAYDYTSDGELPERQIADPLSIGENDQIENVELGMAIEECLSQIPEKHAQVFSLKTIENWNTEDICKELNISPSNLWVMVHRARTALMDCLNTQWFKNP